MGFEKSVFLVYGAGSIGCFIGGRLAAAGANVRFLLRPRLAAELAKHGLTLSDMSGPRVYLPPGELQLQTKLVPTRAPELILLTVKSAASADAAREIQLCFGNAVPVLSLQNGVENVATMRAAAPGLIVIPGMVPFNVLQRGPGQWHRGTSGELCAEDHPTLAPLLPLFERASLPLSLAERLLPVQWGKLLLNLNNPLNALSGLPLVSELADRGYRVLLATLMDEALTALAAAEFNPASVGAAPPKLVPQLLRLPTWLFKIAAAGMLKMDPLARSSMWEDFQAGREPEIDALCGAVVRLAERYGTQAPLNRRLLELVKNPEARTRTWSAPELSSALTAHGQ